jgi:transposase, IS5 family
LLGEEGVEELLAQTINAAVDLKLIKAQELTRVIVDSTVQHKAIAHPTDSRLLETARTKLVEAAKGAGIGLKQTFAKEGKALGYKAARYAHARQFKRMNRAIKRQRTIVGRLQREVDRKASAIGAAVREAMGETLNKAQRKAVDGQRKLYAWHATEVDSISKGKVRTPYEFGVKVGIASSCRAT